MKIDKPSSWSKLTFWQKSVAVLAASTLFSRDMFAGVAAQTSGTALTPLANPTSAWGGRRLLQGASAPAAADLQGLEQTVNTCDFSWDEEEAGHPLAVSRFAAQTQVDSALPEQRNVYNFETSTQGWEAASPNDTVSLTGLHAFDGSRSLAFTVSVPSAGDHLAQIMGPETVPANATLGMQVWLPADAPVRWANIFMKDGADYRWTGGNGLSPTQLRPDQWNALNLTAPADANVTQTIGLQLTFAAPWCGKVLVDAVGWPGNPTRDLSQSTAFLRNLATPTGPRLGLFGVQQTLLGYEASMVHIDSCGTDIADLTSSLDRIRVASGGNTVRMWFLQSAGGSQDWSRYELAVKHAKLRGLRIIPTLVNQWGNCEPMINGTENLKTIEWYRQGYKETGDGYPESFRDFAGKITRHFAHEETIAFWQIGNELEARLPNGSCDANAATLALRGFADDMTGVIHHNDRNHMVNLGTLGGDQCGLAGDGWQTVHAGAVDITEVHDYNPGNITVADSIAQRILQSQALNKPIIVGEMGLCRSLQEDGSCSGNVTDATLQWRAQRFGAKINALIAQGASGVSIWAYNYDPTYSVEPGDPVEAVMQQAAVANL